MNLIPIPPKAFDIKLDWAKRQPGFTCRRTGDTLDYLIDDGDPFLRVVRHGDRAALYMRLGPVMESRPYK